MADNLRLRGTPDRTRVNVNERWEVDYWCKEFGCTVAELLAAVQAVGVSVANVRNYLLATRRNRFAAGLPRL